jgi:hypothetical protein
LGRSIPTWWHPHAPQGRGSCDSGLLLQKEYFILWPCCQALAESVDPAGVASPTLLSRFLAVNPRSWRAVRHECPLRACNGVSRRVLALLGVTGSSIPLCSQKAPEGFRWSDSLRPRERLSSSGSPVGYSPPRCGDEMSTAESEPGSQALDCAEFCITLIRVLDGVNKRLGGDVGGSDGVRVLLPFSSY